MIVSRNRIGCAQVESLAGHGQLVVEVPFVRPCSDEQNGLEEGVSIDVQATFRLPHRVQQFFQSLVRGVMLHAPEQLPKLLQPKFNSIFLAYIFGCLFLGKIAHIRPSNQMVFPSA
jgi:hypothetical protein